ncbi:site-specific recombinase XerD [Paenibacillus forsythiae]|uniref:Site-specific recombinase XerD n=1 Tax=Paenibacillus forsythiae TaxID=365616 RepID=A0ABU3HEF0_9BACL|nr:hypothetical protein [Paenibacillus forsythiae]MDT3429193.1 site-specific recombinase XerD [Paenibacillus forsythiae]
MQTFEEKLVTYLPLLHKHHKDSETTLCVRFIEPLLINLLGYECEIKYEEHPEGSNEETDLFLNDHQGNYLIVEVKKAEKPLTDVHIRKLSAYLNNNTQKYKWGILTNGYRWILINNEITASSYLERKIFDIDISNKRLGENNRRDLELFSYNALFKNDGITNYYRLIQQFKNIQYNGNGKSWTQYRTAVKKLVQFMIETEGRFIDLKDIRKYEVLKYFRWLALAESNSAKSKNNNIQKIKPKTVEAQYRFLSTFYKKVYPQTNHPLTQVSLSELLQEISDVLQKDDENKEVIIDQNVIAMVYKGLASKNQLIMVRNKLIFSLCLMGLDRSEIAKLLNKALHEDNKLTLSNGRRIELPSGIANRINHYKELRKKNKIKSQWLISKSKGEPLTEQYISGLINDIAKQISPNLTLEKIQQYMLKQYIYRTKDVISLIYLTGLSFHRIQNILTEDDIILLSKKKDLYKNHPFQNFLLSDQEE